MTRRLFALLALLALFPAAASAQSDDAAYCSKLAGLAYKFLGAGGGEGIRSPSIQTLSAIDDCNKGNFARGIPYLEMKLRDARVNLPPRS